MFAYRLHPQSASFAREKVPIPTPAADEVLIKILAAGVCHSDVTCVRNPEIATMFSRDGFTLGHEGAGVIMSLGPSVSSQSYPQLTIGTHVVMFGANACFQASCEFCSTGRDNGCKTFPSFGMGTDGFFASYAAVRAACLVPIPTSPSTIPLPVAAVATDAALTPYRALKTTAQLQAGENVLIIGCGGLGQNAVQIAKNCLQGGVVIACDIRDSSLEIAKEVGADHAVSPDRVKEVLEGSNISVDVVVDFVGSQSTFDLALSSVKPSGRIVLVGAAPQNIQLSTMLAISKEVKILPNLWGCKRELEEVMQAIADGKVKPIVETRPMDHCTQVLEELHDGKLKSRVALIPSNAE